MLDQIVERKIEEAIARGELDGLPGAGRPLELDDDALVPEDLRMAYRILKNAGYIPPEVETVNHIAALERFALGDALGRARELVRRADQRHFRVGGDRR